MGLTILVADDSPTMRTVLQMTFAGVDARVVAVDSGDAAIAQAASLRPDIVLADASMPTDGYAVARSLRDIPVIVMCSQANPFDPSKAGDGVESVVKPFETAKLIELVTRVASQPRAAAPAAARAPAPPPMLPTPPPAAPPMAARPAPAPQPAPAPPVMRPAPAAAAPPVLRTQPGVTAPPPPATASVGRAVSDQMAPKLSQLGLSAEQAEAVMRLSKDVIERVVWEVVPDLAETIIREEIRRLTADSAG